MDLSLYLRVLWRFRALLTVGLVIASIVGILAYVRISVGADGISVTHRQSETWAARSVLLVTQSGFPWGRSVPEQDVVPVTRKGLPSYVVPRFADPDRFKELAVVYANLVDSEGVRSVMAESGPVRGSVSAAPRGLDNGVIPLIDLTGLSTSPAEAVSVAKRGAAALRVYIGRLQEANDIPVAQRVILQTVERAESAQLVAPRKKTRPIFLFAAIMTVFVGVAFILENLRPAVRLAPSAPPILEDASRPAARIRS